MSERDPYIGLVLGDRYRLVRKLGAGGFATVYEAEHVSLDRHFALKLLRRDLEHDEAFARRFEREARLTSALDHPHIVAVTDFGRDPRAGLFLVMELLKGEDLFARVRSEGALPLPEALRIGRQIVEAFAYAHGRGLVHRDVKSANVFLVSDDVRKDHAKVLDFGIARMAALDEAGDAARLTHTGQVMGSPAYMAPEQALNLKVDARTDIYALGIVLYEMVTGRVPFKAASALETLNHHLHSAPPPPSAIRPDVRVPPGLELVILKCLQKKMDARFQTTGALATALEDAERQATSGQDAPTDVMATLFDLRRSMVEEGALLQGKDGEDLRRLVGGRGYTKALKALSRRTSRLAWVALAALAGLLVAGVSGVWVATRPTSVEAPSIAPAQPVVPAPMPATTRAPTPAQPPDATPAPVPGAAPAAVPPPVAPPVVTRATDAGAEQAGTPAVEPPTQVVAPPKAKAGVRPPGGKPKPAPKPEPKPTPKPAEDPYGGI